MPKQRSRRVRRVIYLLDQMCRWPWYHGYDRGWNEATGSAASDIECLANQTAGAYISKADLRALALRVRREATD